LQTYRSDAPSPQGQQVSGSYSRRRDIVDHDVVAWGAQEMLAQENDGHTSPARLKILDTQGHWAHDHPVDQVRA
jgi:hypothetical protein